MIQRTQRRSVGAATQSQTEGVVRRHRPDYQIVLFMGLLMLFGLIIMYAIGPQRANVLNSAFGTDNYSDTYFFVKQTTNLLLALGAFVVLALVPYTFILKHAKKLLWVGLGACALLAVSGWIGLGIAHCTLGACRWFDLGVLGSNLQPAEILKFGLLVFLAGFLGMRSRQGLINDIHKTLIPLGVIVGIAMLFVIVIQKDLGTGIAMVAVVAAMLMVAGISKKIGLILLSIAVLVGVLFIATAGHRVDRFTTFLQGDATSTDDPSAYHIQHAKIALGTGGLFGVGIGNSVQATGYLPEAINDSVFAIMGETFGFVGLMAILLIFVALLMRLLKVMDHLVDIRLKLLAAGVFGWFGAHVMLNIAAMIGIAPLTGITLPLLSSGGTSMFFIAAALGLVFQLSRYTVHGSRLKETTYENSGSGRGIRRTRHTGRRGSARA